ncbi:MAG: hypothetical protein K9J06_08420 [Flavobacteriales bacterium]|nr:hypothetical protein [Flavobacteriales bacterium]
METIERLRIIEQIGDLAELILRAAPGNPSIRGWEAQIHDLRRKLTLTTDRT